MTTVISVINQKGGVGKTATALAIFDGLKAQGKRCLFIDLDHQQNGSLALAADLETASIANVLEHETNTADAIQHLKRGDVIPAADDLAELEETIDTLDSCLKEVKQAYDVIILDTPPSVSSLTANSLAAADIAVIPAQADDFSLQGIGKLHATTLPRVNAKRKEVLNKEPVKVAGILLTRYNARGIHSQAYTTVLQNFAKTLGTKVFKSKIRNCISISEANTAKLSIFDYAPKSNAAQDYTDFITELLKDI